MTIEIVFLDIGGVLYDDTVYARAWHRALRDAGARFTDDEFDEEYARARTEQAGSFRRRLIARFLPDGDLRELESLAARYWHYPPVRALRRRVPCLEALRGRYRLGVIANQPGEVRTAMRRDGLEPFFEVWGVSDELGVGKPDPRALRARRRRPPAWLPTAERHGRRPTRLRHAPRQAQWACAPIWMLRGEAPDEPTPEQLAETDAAVGSLAELPAELERLSSA